MFLLTILGTIMVLVSGVMASCVLGFLCNCVKKQKGICKSSANKCLESTATGKNILHTPQQFAVKKIMEPVQPRTWLTSPKIYSPKPMLTVPESVGCRDYTLERIDECQPARGERASFSSFTAESSEDLFVIPQTGANVAGSLSDDGASEISEDWIQDVRLHYGMRYNRYKSELYLTIIEAENINTVENMSLSDSFVVAALVTKLGQAKAETSIQTKTLHPVWQETLTFPAEEEHMQEGTLTLAVYTCDKYSRQNCLGETQLKLSDVGLEERTDSWICLTFPSKDSVALLGEILLSINYLPAASRLIVVVMKAQHLNTDKLKDLIDLSIKLTLTHESLKLKKKHSRHARHKINPVWNEMIMFEVPYEMLCKSSLELELFNQDCTGQSHLLGKCNLGLNYSDLELSHWQEMLTKPRKQIAMWHKLHA
ncbi:synaptotagmin-13 [Rhinoraja longicauda]